MAFEIFRPVSSTGRPLFDLGEDHRAGRLGTCEVTLKVPYVNEYAIDYPRDR